MTKVDTEKLREVADGMTGAFPHLAVGDVIREAADELDATRSRPSGLALEWDGTRLRLGKLWIASFFPLSGGGFGYQIYAGELVEMRSGFDTKEAAQAAVERAVRSALGVEDGE